MNKKPDRTQTTATDGRDSGDLNDRQAAALRRALSTLEKSERDRAAWKAAMQEILRLSRFEGKVSSQSPAADLVLPPLHTLARLGCLLLNPRMYRRYVEPHIDEIRYEYYEALRAGRRGLARWILVRGWLTITWPLWEGLAKTMFAIRNASKEKE